MKKIYFALAISLHFFSNAQNVGINASGNTPDASAMLDVSATNKGLLIPRVSLSSTTDNTTVPTPTTSLLVYNTNVSITNGNGEGYYYNGGTPSSPNWVKLYASNVKPWETIGNSGTSASTNFLGTTDAVDLVLRTNNSEKMRIMSGGNVGIGTASPSYKLDITPDATTGTGIRVLDNNTNPGVQFLTIGDDTYLTDFDVANTLGIYGQQNSAVGSIQLGSGGGYLYGSNSNIGIGTSAPSEKLHVNGGNARISGLSGIGNRVVYANNNGVLVTSNVAPGSVTVPIGCSSVSTSTINETFESNPNGWTLTAGTGAVRIGTAYANCAGSCITGDSRNGSGALQFQLCANNCNNCVWAEKSYDFGNQGGSFSFWYKIGSESGYDYLRVFVDGVQQGEWSGCNNTWTQITVSGVASGTHTIRFAFRTDGSTISNGGRAQVDDLVITKGDLPTSSSCVETTQRIIRGTVNANGTVASGGGFVVTKDGDGRYRITFITPFSDIPSASATQIFTGVGALGATDSGNTRDNAVIYGISANGINIATGDGAGDRSDRSFSFIVIGSQ